MMKLNLIAGILISCLSLSFKTPGTKESTDPPMNILFITADDMGMQMGYLNTPGLETPTLDSLARNGTFFTKTYATFPSCSPSRTSFLTGTYPHVNGVTTNVHEYVGANPPEGFIKQSAELNTQFAVNKNVTTLIEVLKKQGYFTGLTGKFHISSREKFPFDYWGKDVNAEQFFKEAKKSKKPFFLDYNLHSPHRPYEKSPRERSKINLDNLDVPPYLPNNALMQKDWSDYLGAVEATDRSVKELLSHLKREGLDKNTLIVFLSDHGPSIHRGKYYAYNFGSHVPLILSGPNITKGRKSKSLTSLADLMPTVLDLLNIPVPASVNGKSFKKVLENQDTPINKYIFTEVSFPRKGETNYQARGMTDGRFWYIRRNGKPRMAGKPEDNYEVKNWGNYSYKATLDGKGEFPLQYRLLQASENLPPREELFDLYSDPWSMHDIITNEEYKNVLSRMSMEMDAWITRTNDKEMLMTVKN